MPPDVYYGEGDTSWLKVDFGITEWGARATPNTYFNAAYVTGAAYNESHWSDPEFDALIAQINSELDRAKRVALYKQAQQILIERGPVIVPFFETAAAGVSATVRRHRRSRPTGRGPYSAPPTSRGDQEGRSEHAGWLVRLRRGAGVYWRRLRRQPVALAGTIIFVLFLFMALLRPAHRSLRLHRPGRGRTAPGPQPRHLMGTDNFGRDVFSRVLVGARDVFFLGGVGTSAGGHHRHLSGTAGRVRGAPLGRGHHAACSTCSLPSRPFCWPWCFWPPSAPPTST